MWDTARSRFGMAFTFSTPNFSSCSRIFPNSYQHCVQFFLRPSVYAGQAEEWIRTCPKSKLDTYRAIVIVSGDGLVNEIVNGLASRQQCDTDLSNPLFIPIGIIPAGGGNATAAAVCYHSGLSFRQIRLLHSAYILCHPEPTEAPSQDQKNDLGLRQIHQIYHPLDCIAFELLRHSNLRRYGILSVIWGGLAEIDVRSERFRWLGSSRFAFAGIYSFIGKDSVLCSFLIWMVKLNQSHD
ncbi:unnamed protein product [Dicrocoelium dendriticum]|nr:unnamed protein product [Dicrocoelium dendriticum]